MSDTNGKPKGYIPDGYTKKAFIKTEYNLYPDVRFKFRPCQIPEQAVIVDSIQRESSRAGQKMLSEMLASRIVECDLKDFKADVSFVMKMEPKLFDRMCNIVLGNEGGDEDPQDDGNDVDYSNQRKSELAAAIAGDPVEEYSAKN